MKKMVVGIVLVAVVAVGGFLVYKNVSAKKSAQNVNSQFARGKVTVKDITQSVSGSGSVQASQSEVFKAAGKDTVASVLVNNNQIVSTGDELVTFTNGSAPIVADMSGVISAVNVNPGDNVNQGTPLVTMFNNTNLLTTISVDETDVTKLKVGQKADIKLNAFPDTKFTGTVTSISQQGQYSNGVSNFDVSVYFDEVQNIKVGMSTEVSITTDSKNNVLVIPVEAVRDINGGKYVLVYDGNKTSMKKVELGISDGKSVEVTNGLIAGEEVQLPQVKSSSTNSSTRGMGSFQMMRNSGGGNKQSGSQGSSNRSSN
ncbi:efflux RND transporter periplasmic adaptor subunit [Clostridium ljungdahlii]|uniref:Macrolide export protein MacA n=1 Tax=Clostridium ljungdahlii TaxID=1538 RepID=A0A170NJC4_9CLOT|nr:efflux RND transporter periplasmic adaptor subunit [Clostridium ljungdahlii]OAA90250.1 Macrolide export protein MacA [Clostridium ljungdahlii]